MSSISRFSSSTHQVQNNSAEPKSRSRFSFKEKFLKLGQIFHLFSNRKPNPIVLSVQNPVALPVQIGLQEDEFADGDQAIFPEDEFEDGDTAIFPEKS